MRCCAAGRRPERSGRFWREELGNRRTNLAIWLQRDPDETIGAVALGAFGQVINIRTSDPAATRDTDGADPSAAGARLIKHLESGALRKRRAKIDQLHREANVGLVGAVALHRLVVGKRWERQLLNWAIGSDALRHLDHHCLDIGTHARLVYEAHLNVELGELRLPVTAEILVAEAAGDLEVAVKARDHQELLHLLRRLRQRVDTPLLQSRWHDEVAGALRGRLDEDRRLHLDESVLVMHFANGLHHRAAQENPVAERFAAQVEVPILQS